MQITFGLVTILSFLINFTFAGITIYQVVSSKKEEENTKAKVKLWQKSAEGLKNGLLGVAMSSDNYTNKSDIASAIQSLAQVATSFDGSFVEERFYTEGEVKQKREDTMKEQEKLFESFKTSSNQNKLP